MQLTSMYICLQSMTRNVCRLASSLSPTQTDTQTASEPIESTSVSPEEQPTPTSGALKLYLRDRALSLLSAAVLVLLFNTN